MKLGLVAGGYPPDLDGIGDYTYWLARALAERPDVSRPVDVYTRTGDHAPAEGVRIRPFFELSRQSSFRGLLPLVREDCPDWLVLQYNPFCWGARGWCPAVPWTLSQLKAMPRAPKVAVMFHETTVPKWPWRFALMYAWQRPILRSVAAQAQAVFVSTKRWLPEISPFHARARAVVLPVGSNIPRSHLSKEEAKSLAGVAANRLVIGLFGGMHVSKPVSWIAEVIRQAVRQNVKHTVLHVGPCGAVIQRGLSSPDFLTLGVLSADAAADALRAMDCVLSPFTDGVSTRRGSVLAALNNGVPVATTRREWSDDILCAAPQGVLLASSASEAGQFARDVIDWIPRTSGSASADCQKFFDNHFSWRLVADRLMQTITAS